MNQLSNVQSYLPAANPLKNAQSGLQIPQITGQIGYPTTMLPTRPPILTQQIIADFQLSQEVWDHLSNQMNEMDETNRLLKGGVNNTYKNLTNVKKQGAKKTLNIKFVMKREKQWDLLIPKVDKLKKNNKLTEKRDDANSSKKNVTTKHDSDTVIKYRFSDRDPSMIIGEDDSVGWRNPPELLESSDKDNICDSDDEEGLPQKFYKQEHMISNIEYAKLKLAILQ